MIVPDAGTARVLRTQPEIARAIERFPDVTKAVVGVGAWQPGASTVADAMTERERREIHDLGVLRRALRASSSTPTGDAGDDRRSPTG